MGAVQADQDDQDDLDQAGRMEEIRVQVRPKVGLLHLEELEAL